MPNLAGLHGLPGLALICGLLYLEEAGLPLPFAPGEAVLVACGLLIASGGIPAPLGFLGPYLAVALGAGSGFGWASLVGRVRLRALARRLHADRAFDKAAERLATATPVQIGISRLIPGLRIYTTLVAGAVGTPVRTFLLGALPAIAIWTAIFVLLGIFVGAPAARLFGRFESWAVRGAELAGVILLAYLALRRIPASRPSLPRQPFSKLREGLALVVDVSVVVLVVAGLSLLTALVGQDADSFLSGLLIYGAIAILYILIARRSMGFTLGEMVLEVRYRRPHLASAPTS